MLQILTLPLDIFASEIFRLHYFDEWFENISQNARDWTSKNNYLHPINHHNPLKCIGLVLSRILNRYLFTSLKKSAFTKSNSLTISVISALD